MVNDSVDPAIHPMAGSKPQIEPEGIKCKTKSIDSELSGVGHQNSKYRWMQVQVEMSVYMIHRQTGLGDPLKLLVNFSSQLLAQSATKEVARAYSERALVKFTDPVHQAGNFFLGQSGVAAKECQVKANGESGMFASQCNGLGKTGLVDHETCAGKNAFAVGTYHGLIYGGGTSKIIGVDYQAANRSAVVPGYGISHSKRSCAIIGGHRA